MAICTSQVRPVLLFGPLAGRMRSIRTVQAVCARSLTWLAWLGSLGRFQKPHYQTQGCLRRLINTSKRPLSRRNTYYFRKYVLLMSTHHLKPQMSTNEPEIDVCYLGSRHLHIYLAYAIGVASKTGRIGKSVLNISLDSAISSKTNQAIAEAVNQGICLAGAAGNPGLLTITTSPASAAEVGTVGGSGSNVARESLSVSGCWSMCPLLELMSCPLELNKNWPDDSNEISGTSVVCPNIISLIAYLSALQMLQSSQGKSFQVDYISYRAETHKPRRKLLVQTLGTWSNVGRPCS